MTDEVAEKISSKLGPTTTGTRTILSLKRAITSQNCAKLESTINEYIDQSKTEIILDCQALSFLDSDALEFLFRMHEKLKALGGKLKFICIDDVCRDILVATRLINIFDIYKF